MKINRKKVVLILEILALLGILVAALILVRQRQELRKKASTAEATAWFEATRTDDDHLTVNLIANFGQKSVTGFNLKIIYSPDQLSLTENGIDLHNSFETNQGGVVIDKRVDQSGGAIYLSNLAITNPPSGGLAPWINFNFKIIGDGQAQIKLINNQQEYYLYEIVGFSDTDEDSQIILANPQGGQEIELAYDLSIQPEPTPTLGLETTPTPPPLTEPTPTLISPTPTSPPSPGELKDIYLYQEEGREEIISLNNQYSNSISFTPAEDSRLKEIEVFVGNWGGAWRHATCKLERKGGGILFEKTTPDFRKESGQESLAWQKISFNQLPLQERPLLRKEQTYEFYCRSDDTWGSLYWPGIAGQRAARVLASITTTPEPPPGPTSCLSACGSDSYLYKNETRLAYVSLNNQYQHSVELTSENYVRIKQIEVLIGNWGGAWRKATCKLEKNNGEDLFEKTTNQFRNDKLDWRTISFADLDFKDRPLLNGSESYRLFCRGDDDWSSLYWQGAGQERAARILVSPCCQ